MEEIKVYVTKQQRSIQKDEFKECIQKLEHR